MAHGAPSSSDDAGLAAALLSKGAALAESGEHDAAISRFAQVLARFEAAEDPRLHGFVLEAHARLIREAVGCPDEAFKAADALDTWIGAGARRVGPASLAEAIAAGTAACDAVVRAGGRHDTGVSQERIAAAMWLKSLLLGKAGDREGELLALEELLARFGAATAPMLSATVSRAIYNKGILLQDMDRASEALAAWNAVCERLGSFGETEQPSELFDALYAKSYGLYDLGRLAEAVASCDDAVGRYGAPERSDRILWVARMLEVKRDALTKAGRLDDALTVDDELLVRGSRSVLPGLEVRRARALLHKTLVLAETGRSAEAVVEQGRLLGGFLVQADPGDLVTLGELVRKGAKALLNVGYQRAILRWTSPTKRACSERGLEDLEAVINRMQREDNFEARKLIVRAVLDRSAALVRLGRLRQSTKEYEAIFALGEPAIAVLEDVVRAAAASRSRYSHDEQAQALTVRAAILERLGERIETLKAADEIIQRFDRDRSILVRALVRQARKQRDALLADGVAVPH